MLRIRRSGPGPWIARLSVFGQVGHPDPAFRPSLRIDRVRAHGEQPGEPPLVVDEDNRRARFFGVDRETCERPAVQRDPNDMCLDRHDEGVGVPELGAGLSQELKESMTVAFDTSPPGLAAPGQPRPYGDATHDQNRNRCETAHSLLLVSEQGWTKYIL